VILYKSDSDNAALINTRSIRIDGLWGDVQKTVVGWGKETKEEAIIPRSKASSSESRMVRDCTNHKREIEIEVKECVEYMRIIGDNDDDA
jgi:hypothetical protein